jgi:hypothetical protein
MNDTLTTGTGDPHEPFDERAIDAILADSFPASDPPPWTLGVSSRAPVEPHGAVPSDDERRGPWTIRDAAAQKHK